MDLLRSAAARFTASCVPPFGGARGFSERLADVAGPLHRAAAALLARLAATTPQPERRRVVSLPDSLVARALTVTS